jgi:hypothetical protein
MDRYGGSGRNRNVGWIVLIVDQRDVNRRRRKVVAVAGTGLPTVIATAGPQADKEAEKEQRDDPSRGCRRMFRDPRLHRANVAADRSGAGLREAADRRGQVDKLVDLTLLENAVGP